MRQRRLGASLLIGIVVAVILAGAVALAEQGEPPYKQDLEAQHASVQATAQAAPHGQKHPEDVPLSSCPRQLQTAIYPFQEGPFSGGQNMVSSASTVSTDGTPFMIYSGADDVNANQGLIIVLRLDKDPCASPDRPNQKLSSYLSPAQSGALRMVSIDGDVVTLTNPGGKQISFNYLTGRFQ